ncbi:hypothetical protein [Streptomyces profundus]|uniref:hypothetical protein n=1 Tax=Streptomyces profundus TaxID=2867410 RepID=UPI001D15F0B0|nr:hypothetical protein [Streptomyces sp. MA3_2.13]UED86346.1 hypothetical protein K4G22_20875 [Streptomyces sp. MA3_2.13]
MNWTVPVVPTPSQQYEYPALGFVPCPGDAATTSHVAQQVRQTTTALGDVVSLLRGTGDNEWRGRSAEAWREQWDDDFRPKIEAAHESFRIAAIALEEWANHMPRAQQEALQLEEEAHAAQARIDRLPTPAGFGEILTIEADEERDEAIADAQRAQDDLDRAGADLETIRQRAHALAQDYTERGEHIADRLGHAMDIAPNKPGWLSSLGDWLGGVIEDVVSIALDVLQNIGSWIAENAARIAAIGNLLAAISTVLGAAALVTGAIGAFVPFMAPLMIPTSLALSGMSTGYAALALVAHGTARVAGADVSVRTLGQDLLGTIPVAGYVRHGGNLARVIGSSTPTQIISGAAFWDSLVGTIGDASALEYLKPRDLRQAFEMVLPTGVGTLWVGFENAWRDGGRVQETEDGPDR